MPIDTQDDEALTVVKDLSLTTRGFTNSGVKHFRETVRDYSQCLLERAVHYGDIVKADGMPAEITHDHVRSSAHSIAQGFGTPERPKWLIATQIGEYLGTAAAGVGAGYLKDPWGIVTFALGVSTAVILVAVRLNTWKTD